MTHPCGLHIVVAPTGSGKSMFLMQSVGYDLARTNRTVVTNLPINFEGLMEVMNELYVGSGPVAGTWTIEGLRKRVWIISEVGEVRRYYQCRGFGWYLIAIDDEEYNQDRRPDWSVAYRYREKIDDGRERQPLYKLTRKAVDRLYQEGELDRCLMADLPPCSFKIDEAGDYLAKMSARHLGCCYPYYQRMKRKIGVIGDDTTMACQYATQIDLELREQANDWMFLVNWAARRKGIFYLPSKATWAKFPKLPQKGDSPMLTGFFSIDGKSWGRTYDTSAGVGLEGGFQADKGQKVGGISWMWVPVGFAVAVYLISQSPHGFSGLLRWWLQGKRQQPVQAVVGPAAPVVQQAVHATNKVTLVDQVPLLELDSLAFVGGRLVMYWSDGSRTRSDEKGFGGVLRSGSKVDGVIWDGRKCWLSSGQLVRQRQAGKVNPDEKFPY